MMYKKLSTIAILITLVLPQITLASLPSRQKADLSPKISTILNEALPHLRGVKGPVMDTINKLFTIISVNIILSDTKETYKVIVNIKKHAVKVEKGALASPDATITIDSRGRLEKILNGKEDPLPAFKQGKINFKGNGWKFKLLIPALNRFIAGIKPY